MAGAEDHHLRGGGGGAGPAGGDHENPGAPPPPPSSARGQEVEQAAPTDPAQDVSLDNLLRTLDKIPRYTNVDAKEVALELFNSLFSQQFLYLSKRNPGSGLREWEVRSFVAACIFWAVLGLSRERSQVMFSCYVFAQNQGLAVYILPQSRLDELLSGYKSYKLDLPGGLWLGENPERIAHYKDSALSIAVACLELAKIVATAAGVDTASLREQSQSYFRSFSIQTPKLFAVAPVTSGTEPVVPSAEPPRTSQHEIERIMARMPKRSPMLQKWFSEGGAKRVRLDRGLGHEMEPLGYREIKTGPNVGVMKAIQATCAFCGGQATYRCVTCKVPLHRTACAGDPKRNLGSRAPTCFERFHACNTLEGPPNTKRAKLHSTADGMGVLVAPVRDSLPDVPHEPEH